MKIKKKPNWANGWIKTAHFCSPCSTLSVPSVVAPKLNHHGSWRVGRIPTPLLPWVLFFVHIFLCKLAQRIANLFWFGLPQILLIVQPSRARGLPKDLPFQKAQPNICLKKVSLSVFQCVTVELPFLSSYQNFIWVKIPLVLDLWYWSLRTNWPQEIVWKIVVIVLLILPSHPGPGVKTYVFNTNFS